MVRLVKSGYGIRVMFEGGPIDGEVRMLSTVPGTFYVETWEPDPTSVPGFRPKPNIIRRHRYDLTRDYNVDRDATIYRYKGASP